MRFGMVTNLKEDSFGFSMLMILKKQNQPKKNFISIHQIFGLLKPNEYQKDCDYLACQL